MTVSNETLQGGIAASYILLIHHVPNTFPVGHLHHVKFDPADVS